MRLKYSYSTRDAANILIELYEKILENGSDVSTLLDQDDIINILGYSPENTNNKNQLGGYAGLDNNGKLSPSVIPSINITDIFVANSEAAMTSTISQKGDMCIRTDINKTFILSTNDPSVVSNWVEMINSSGEVISINGKSGAVNLTADDLLEGISNKIFTLQHKNKLDSISEGAQKNSDITKSEIESKLTGNITTHSHNVPPHFNSHITGGSDVIPNAIPNSSSGLMSGQDKAKLNSIESNANRYIHPANHPSSIIIQSPTSRFVTDMQIQMWNSKSDLLLGDISSRAFRGDLGKIAYTHSISIHAPNDATKNQTDNYLLNRTNHTGTQSADTLINGNRNKVFTVEMFNKLNNIPDNINWEGGNVYEHPEFHPASIITQDEDNRFVTDLLISRWNNSYNHSISDHAPADATKNQTDNYLLNRTNHTGTQSADTLINGTYNKIFTSELLNKLNNISENANNYIHPVNHSADIIVDGIINKVFTNTLLNKLNGVASNANNYTHPVNHDPSVINQDEDNRFVTDVQMSNWGLAYVHSQSTHAPSDATKNQTDIYLLNRTNHTGTQSADTITDGATNKVFTNTLLNKLNSIESNANNYAHPSNHSPSIITQDINNRFVTDTQIANWSSAYSHSQDTHAPSDATKNDTDANLKNRSNHTGTQSADTIVDGTTNKVFTNTLLTKLNGISTGANNYIHPANHSPSIITQDINNRFVTDDQIINWNLSFSHSQTIHAPNDAQKNSDITKEEIESKLTGIISSHTHDDGSVVTETDIENWNNAYGHSQTVHAPAGATINDTDANLKNRSNHTGTQSADTIVNGTTNKVFTDTLLSKLNGIENNANNYTHPSNHSPSIITQDVNNRFVTDAQIAAWNNKSELTLGIINTTAYRGDYGNIAYNHSQSLHAPTDATKNDTDANLKNRSNHTGTQSADTITEGTVNKLFTDTLLTKLNGISTNANNYVHPSNHNPSIITQDENNRFVTDDQITNWNNKSNLSLGTTSGTAYRGDYGNAAYAHSQSAHAPSGATINDTDANLKNRANHTGTQSADTITDGTTNKVFTNTLLTKLNGISSGANNYIHPSNHDPSIITQDENNRFVTDTQINTWNNKIDMILGTASNTAYRGDYGNIAYTHSQSAHAPAGATINDTDANLKNRSNHTGTQSADTITDGTTNKVFTNTLLNKLNNIADNANNYSHPANHSPSIITQDINNRFVTDAQISAWDNKSTLSLGTTSTTAYRGDYGNTAYSHSQSTHAPTDATKNDTDANLKNRSNHTGTQSADTITDGTTNKVFTNTLLTKLNGIEASANNYSHPVSHSPSIIIQDSSNRFVTDTQITNWGLAYTHCQAIHAPNDAQKNSDITKAEIEAKLTGTISTHSHTPSNTILYGTDDPPAGGQTEGTIYFKITS